MLSLPAPKPPRDSSAWPMQAPLRGGMSPEDSRRFLLEHLRWSDFVSCPPAIQKHGGGSRELSVAP